MVFIAVVGAIIHQVVLQAGARGGGVTAAERNAIQQVTAVHVTPDTTGNRAGLYMFSHIGGNAQVKRSDF